MRMTKVDIFFLFSTNWIGELPYDKEKRRTNHCSDFLTKKLVPKSRSFQGILICYKAAVLQGMRIAAACDYNPVVCVLIKK